MLKPLDLGSSCLRTLAPAAEILREAEAAEGPVKGAGLAAAGDSGLDTVVRGPLEAGSHCG